MRATRSWRRGHDHASRDGPTDEGKSTGGREGGRQRYPVVRRALRSRHTICALGDGVQEEPGGRVESAKSSTRRTRRPTTEQRRQRRHRPDVLREQEGARSSQRGGDVATPPPAALPRREGAWGTRPRAVAPLALYWRQRSASTPPSGSATRSGEICGADRPRRRPARLADRRRRPRRRGGGGAQGGGGGRGAFGSPTSRARARRARPRRQRGARPVRRHRDWLHGDGGAQPAQQARRRADVDCQRRRRRRRRRCSSRAAVGAPRGAHADDSALASTGPSATPSPSLASSAPAPLREPRPTSARCARSPPPPRSFSVAITDNGQAYSWGSKVGGAGRRRRGQRWGRRASSQWTGWRRWRRATATRRPPRQRRGVRLWRRRRRPAGRGGHRRAAARRTRRGGQRAEGEGDRRGRARSVARGSDVAAKAAPSRRTTPRTDGNAAAARLGERPLVADAQKRRCTTTTARDGIIEFGQGGSRRWRGGARRVASRGGRGRRTPVGLEARGGRSARRTRCSSGGERPLIVQWTAGADALSFRHLQPANRRLRQISDRPGAEHTLDISGDGYVYAWGKGSAALARADDVSEPTFRPSCTAPPARAAFVVAAGGRRRATRARDGGRRALGVGAEWRRPARHRLRRRHGAARGPPRSA